MLTGKLVSWVYEDEEGFLAAEFLGSGLGGAPVPGRQLSRSCGGTRRRGCR